MPSVTWSLAGMRRRAAIWLIAAWAVFGVSQALALCCVDAPSPAFAGSPAQSHHDDGAADDDCCDTTGQICPMMIGEAPPLATTAIVPALAHTLYAYPVPSAAELLPRIPAVGPPRISPSGAAATAPPDPIYLRFQRFLI